MMKTGSVFFLLVLFCCSGCGILKMKNPRRAGKFPEKTEALRLHGELTPQRRCFDVKHYDLNIFIDPFKKQIGGTVTVSAEMVETADSVQLDLHPNFIVKQIRVDGLPVTYSRRYKAMLIPVAAKRGTKFRIAIDYEGIPVVAQKPPWLGGAVWNVDSDMNHWLGVACETEGASIWWPSKDHTSDEADSTSIHLTVPDGYTAVSNGRLEGSETKGNTVTWNWKVSYPINTYNITYYVGRFARVRDKYESKITGQALDLDYYVLPENKTIAQKYFAQVKGILDLYERRFGPYPWYRDGFKFIQSPFEGMEHQTAIAYGEGFSNDPSYGFDYIVLHETAHEWWGNSVTAADLGDAWLQEGFATYAEALYVEDTQGEKAYRDYLLNNRFQIRNRRPLARPQGIRYFNFRDPDIYNKGAWMLHSLRHVLNNDSLFFEIIHTFSTNFQLQIVSSQTFMDWVNQKTGKDYSWFFQQYLYNRFVPELEYTIANEKLYYRWSDRTSFGFVMPQRVAGLAGKDQVIFPKKERVEVFVLNSESDKYFSLPDTDYLLLVKKNKKLKRDFRKQQQKDLFP